MRHVGLGASLWRPMLRDAAYDMALEVAVEKWTVGRGVATRALWLILALGGAVYRKAPLLTARRDRIAMRALQLGASR